MILGTIDDPMIIYVGGKLTFDAIKDDDGKDNGYAVFLAKGDVDISGGCLMNPLKSKIAVYSKGGVKIDNNQVFSGQIYSQIKVEVHDQATIYGSLASKGEIREIHDRNNIYYTPPLESLTSQYFGRIRHGSEGRPAQVVHWLE